MRDEDRDAALLAGGSRFKDGDAKKKRRPKSALSLDAFSRAKRSTYDKRVVLEKKRALAAAKVNKYRKTQRRLGDSIDVPDAFDPVRYAERLDAMDAAGDLPRDDGFGRGRDGRREAPGSYREVIGLQATMRDANARRETDSGSAAPEAAADDVGAKELSARDSTRAKTNKGWNKAVKDGLRHRAKREEREKELAVLRVRWAAEREAREASQKRRAAARDSFRKKNARGQPVMRHRVDKILERLAKEDAETR